MRPSGERADTPTRTSTQHSSEPHYLRTLDDDAGSGVRSKVQEGTMAGKGPHPWPEELQKIAQDPQTEIFGDYAVALFGFDEFEPMWTVFRRDGSMMREEDRAAFARLIRWRDGKDGATDWAKKLVARDEAEAATKADIEAGTLDVDKKGKERIITARNEKGYVRARGGRFHWYEGRKPIREERVSNLLDGTYARLKAKARAAKTGQ
jgi:hypothetical protein